VSDRADLVVELGTEELPPKALRMLSEAFVEGVGRGLAKAGLAYDSLKGFATPRRLGVQVRNLVGSQANTVNERRGPAVTAAFDGDGNPTPAALGFARSCGVSVESLETTESTKGAWLVFRHQLPGASVHDLVPDVVSSVLAGLPIPKRMRWGSIDEAFVRPVHWLVMLYGDRVIDAVMFGVRSGRQTHGHRFHHPGALYVAEPVGYAPLLETQGHVIPDFAARREAVRAQVKEMAVGVGGTAVIDEALLDEVTGMVEWPVALSGNFDRRFLEVPPEALVSAMKGHQKYFHVVDAQGRLLPHFITVSNIESRDPDVVRTGNERVIRPRLADAMFFWNQDRRRRLGERLEQLRAVVFQHQLGSLYKKAERVSQLTGEIVSQLGGQRESGERAGWLSKCDLLTDMVGEFPELQGVMGRYYALHDGESNEVAQALDEQYQPRYAGDSLPVTMTGRALAIADKLDTLTGIFGIGQAPTGDKDPYGLRRAALGVLRIMIEYRLTLDLEPLLAKVVKAYRAQGVKGFDDDHTAAAVFDFMMERLRAYYQDVGIRSDVFDAVSARHPTQPSDFDARVRAVEAFRRLPEAESLAAANKRIRNILRKAEEDIAESIDDALLHEPSERALAEQMAKLLEIVEPLFERREYESALTRLAALRPHVDRYFDEVLVMCDEEPRRRNRLAHLNQLQDLFLRVADLSLLQPSG
jgi:glycyl-tRNA synthetase beta chain